MAPFEGFDLSDFWEETSNYAKDKYIGPVPTDEMIRSVEEELGYKLPESYIALMRVQNGGFSQKKAFPTAIPTSWADDHIAIEGFLSIGWDKTYSLCGRMGSRFMIEEWGTTWFFWTTGNAAPRGSQRWSTSTKRTTTTSPPWRTALRHSSGDWWMKMISTLTTKKR